MWDLGQAGDASNRCSLFLWPDGEMEARGHGPTPASARRDHILTCRPPKRSSTPAILLGARAQDPGWEQRHGPPSEAGQGETRARREAAPRHPAALWQAPRQAWECGCREPRLSPGISFWVLAKRKQSSATMAWHRHSLPGPSRLQPRTSPTQVTDRSLLPSVGKPRHGPSLTWPQLELQPPVCRSQALASSTSGSLWPQAWVEATLGCTCRSQAPGPGR